MRIAEETRRRVLRAANELRYRPNLMARGLRTRVTNTIALITDTVATDAYAGGLDLRRPVLRPRSAAT